MYIVIGGAGEVGYTIARSLSEAGHNIAIIDRDRAACAKVESLDVLVINGNSASPAKLDEAYINSADIYIGVTGSDETNMLSCAIAKLRGCKTVARINNLDYIDEPIETEKFRNLGIDTAICPELVAAIKMSRILSIPSLVDISIFADGKVQALDTRVEPGAPIVGRTLKKSALPTKCNVAAIFRDADVIIPRGSDIFIPLDRAIIVMSDLEKVEYIGKLFGHHEKVDLKDVVKKVMIIGASRIGMHLAKTLQEQELNVILIDTSEEKCNFASEKLPKVLVIHGDGTDRELLMDEGITSVDAFLATTNKEETNILSCLLAKQHSAKRTIALVNRTGIKSMLEDVGVDIVVSPRLVTVSTILKYVHRPGLLSVSILNRGEAQVLEYKITEKSRVREKQLKKIKFPKNTLVAAVIRNDKVLIPRGDFTIKLDDELIVFLRTDAFPRLEKVIRQ
jgi:trk system potassium uptake protein TrkA